MQTALFASSTSHILPPLAGPDHTIATSGMYRARLAVSETDRLAVYRLRFMVFNLELQEGLDGAYVDGYDTDHFDSVCDHLIVEHVVTGVVVGTYRMQPGDVAAKYHGYYSEQEFDFAPYEFMRSQVVELGRACVHRDHRSPDVLNLLWKGVVRYARAHGGRYLIGCCSLTSQDPREGAAVAESLRAYFVEKALVTRPTPAFALPAMAGDLPVLQPPKLLRAYLSLGACICSEPAIDRAFGTIDFLTLLDLEMLHPRVMKRFD